MTFMQKMHIFILKSYTEKKVGTSIGPRIFSFACSMAVSVQQVLAAEITLSLGQIWSLAPVFLLIWQGLPWGFPRIAGEDTGSSEFLTLIRKSVPNHRNYFTWNCCVYTEKVCFLEFKCCKLICKKFQSPPDSMSVDWAAVADRFWYNIYKKLLTAPLKIITFYI